MSKRRDNREHRCKTCRVNLDHCYCRYITPVKSKAKISIVMHKSERSLVSNTATLAEQTIDTAKIYVRGAKDLEFNASDLVLEGHENLYLYPDEDAEVLNSEFISKMSSIGRVNRQRS